MADDNDGKPESPPKPPESPPEPRADKPPTPEPKREERRAEPPTEPDTVKCPECRARVDTDELATHRFLVHNVERRAKAKSDDNDGGDQDETKGPPKRQPEGNKDAKKPSKRKQSRWAEVGWGKR